MNHKFSNIIWLIDNKLTDKYKLFYYYYNDFLLLLYKLFLIKFISYFY